MLPPENANAAVTLVSRGEYVYLVSPVACERRLRRTRRELASVADFFSSRLVEYSTDACLERHLERLRTHGTPRPPDNERSEGKDRNSEDNDDDTEDNDAFWKRWTERIENA